LEALCQGKDKILEARAMENQQQVEIIQLQKAQLEKMEGVCRTKDELIAAREVESQQQAKMLKQNQAECEKLKAKIEVRDKYKLKFHHMKWVTHEVVCNKCVPGVVVSLIPMPPVS